MDVEQRAKVFKALADPNRLRLVLHLAQSGSASGVELAEACGMSVALLSHHWKVLGEAPLFPGDELPVARKLALAERVLGALGRRFELVSLRTHARAVLARHRLPLLAPELPEPRRTISLTPAWV